MTPRKLRPPKLSKVAKRPQSGFDKMKLAFSLILQLQRSHKRAILRLYNLWYGGNKLCFLQPTKKQIDRTNKKSKHLIHQQRRLPHDHRCPFGKIHGPSR